MRVLFAVPDRDLLRCYDKLLEAAFGDVVTAFDGTQVLTMLIEEQYDIVVLDRKLPRVEHQRIVRRLNDTRVPVIVLQERAITLEDLQGEPLANAYMAYPFTSEELIEMIGDVWRKTSEANRFEIAGFAVDEGVFCVGSERVTAAELDVLSALAAGRVVPPGLNAVYIGAINDKLLKLRSNARIRYKAGEGYRLMT